jgi:hypothetical protein
MASYFSREPPTRPGLTALQRESTSGATFEVFVAKMSVDQAELRFFAWWRSQTTLDIVRPVEIHGLANQSNFEVRDQTPAQH